MWLSLDDEVEFSKNALDVLQISRNASSRDIQYLCKTINGNPVAALKQVIKQVVHALFRSGWQPVCRAILLKRTIKLIIVEYQKFISRIAVLDACHARERSICMMDATTNSALAHAEMAGEIVRRDANMVAHERDEAFVACGQLHPVLPSPGFCAACSARYPDSIHQSYEGARSFSTTSPCRTRRQILQLNMGFENTRQRIRIGALVARSFKQEMAFDTVRHVDEGRFLP